MSKTETEEKTDPGITVAGTPTPAPPRRMPDLGALDSLLKDPKITEILVNDLRNVMVETGGKMAFSGYRFPSVEELNRVVRNLLDSIGKAMTPEQPAADGTLPDGSRVQLVGPPIAVQGPSIAIRKFPTHSFKLAELLQGRP